MDEQTAVIINTVIWVAGNLIALSIFISASLFAVLYPIFFNPRLTTAGKLIWRAILSVGGFGLLIVIGLFIDGHVQWYELPSGMEPWRPTVRLVIYGLIAYTYASLVGLLILRRFFPNRIRTAPVDQTLNVRPRDLRRRS